MKDKKNRVFCWKRLRRTEALLLSALMILGNVQVPVYADSEIVPIVEETSGSQDTVVVEEPEEVLVEESELEDVSLEEAVQALEPDEKGVYLLSTPQDLVAFSSEVKKGNSFEGKTVRLANDIDLSNEEWEPIGSVTKVTFNAFEATPFSGIFDGCGYTITMNVASDGDYQGLFACSDGTIQNLTVAGTVSGGNYVAGICAYVSGGMITGCTNKASVSGTGQNIGGIAGCAKKQVSEITIENCSNTGTISSNQASYGTDAWTGGVAGRIQAGTTINGCLNSGSITANGGSTGGVVGAMGGALTNCYNTGSVTSKTTKINSAGGVIGATTAEFHNCYNVGTVSAPDMNTNGRPGAIVGNSTAARAVNSYYLEGTSEYGIGSLWKSNPTGAVAGCKTDSEMKDENFAGILGTAYKINENGYPLLTWQTGDGQPVDPPVQTEVTVTFYNEDKVLKEVKVNSGAKLTEEQIPTPEKEGYTFKYWSKEVHGAAFDIASAITENTILYAVWQDNQAVNWEYDVIDDGTAVKLMKYKGSSSTVVIPTTIENLPVTTIGNNTFTGNTTITYVSMGENITTVENGNGTDGTGAFRGCSKLRTVILSDKLTRIADYMFYGMAADIDYPIQIGWAESKITEIGTFAFSCCNNIVNLELPESVKKIGYGAFYQSRRLKTLDMPGVHEIEADAFTETVFEENYENLWKAGEFSGVVYADRVAYLYMGDDKESKNMAENTEIILKDGTLGISEFLFSNHYVEEASCKNYLKSITVPQTTTFIAKDLFNGYQCVRDDSFVGIDMYGVDESYAENYANTYNNIRFNPLNSGSGYDYKDLDYNWYDHPESEKNYVIHNVNELRAFEDLLDIGEDDFEGATVTLAADIDLGGITERGAYGVEGYSWTRQDGFAGIFDGAGHTISGVYMNTVEDKAGFFGSIKGTGVIKNLNISGKITGKDYVGGIVGDAANGAVIENCSFSGSVTADSVYGYVGGIAGKAMKTTVSGCISSGSVTAAMKEAYREYQQGYTGGILGWNYGSSIKNCINNAAVTGNGFGTGGITGFSQLASVTDSVNKGSVTGYENVGGIVGKVAVSGIMGLHSGCRNEGDVTAVNKAGGIAGLSVGVVNTDDEYQTIFDCCNKGKVTAQNHAGGIMGYVHDSAVNHCYNEGVVSAGQYAGGIGGYVLGGLVKDCYNLGIINADADYAGGILAFDADAESHLTNCYNIGTIQSAEKHRSPLSNVYGDGEGTNENCYYLGEDSKDKAAFTGGEVAYLLGDAFGQELGKDENPVFRNAINQVFCHTLGNNTCYTNDSEPPKISVENITISVDKTTLTKVGETTQLTVHIVPENATNQKVTWKSSDKTIATVDGTGKVTAVANGTVTITAVSEDGNKTASVKIIVKLPQDKPIKEVTSFGILKARSSQQTSTSITLQWSKVNGADGYIIYGNRCNSAGKTYSYKKLKTITNNKTITWTQKNLKKATQYKYIVKAYKLVNGKIKATNTSICVHSITKNSKYEVAKSISVISIGGKKNISEITLKKGKTAKIQAKEIGTGKVIRHHRGIRYESSNTKIATVTKEGTIQAKGKGKCYVWVYAQNGVYKTIPVTVK